MKSIITLFSLLFIGSLSADLSAQTVGHTQTGIASFYSDEFEGDMTAYNEPYRKNELVAAHSLYPHNSRVRVTNLANNNDVVVRIIDQGPWIEGRIIEVSRRAAEMLGFTDEGTTKVKLELLSTPDQPGVASATSKPEESNRPKTRKANEVATPTPAAPDRNAPPRAPKRTDSSTTSASSQTAAPAPKPAERVVSEPEPAQPSRASQQKKEVTEEKASPRRSERPARISRYEPVEDENPMVTNGAFKDGIYKVEIREPGKGAFGVQVASLADLNSTMLQIASLQGKWFDNILVRKIGETYKVILGPFNDQASASRYAKDLKKRYKISGFTVSLETKE